MKYVLLLVCCLSFSCQSDAPADQTPPVTTSVQATPDLPPSATVSGTIEVGTFEDWTGNLDGSCWCLLQLDPDTTNNYCFAFARNGIAGKMNLDGQREVLRRGATVSPSGSKTYLSFLHENDQYRVQTSLNQKDSDEESIYYSGSLTILRKADGQETEAPVSGNCGC
ncbi:MAG: hypothetical protein AAF433_00635 [Bacteroidota bacterium]